MSNSISAAKRRRAGIIASSPMFQSNTANAAASSVAEPTVKRPMSLQQVIGLFDQRLLHLEDYVVKQMKNVPVLDVKPVGTREDVNMDDIASLVQNMMSEHFAEFNHRYEILAEEILNLKHIVMKLQSYTLDVNKTLIEERIQLLSDISSEKKSVVNHVHIDDTLHLRADIENMMASTPMEAAISVEEVQPIQTPHATLDSVQIQLEEEEDAQVDMEKEAQVDLEEEAQVDLEEEAQVNVEEAQPEETEETISKKSSKRQRQKKVVQAIWTDKELNAETEA